MKYATEEEIEASDALYEKYGSLIEEESERQAEEEENEAYRLDEIRWECEHGEY